MFKVDDHIPMPPKRPARMVYPWGSMDVGSSFRVLAKHRPSVSAGAAARAKRYGEKYRVLKDGDGFVRVWREK